MSDSIKVSYDYEGCIATYHRDDHKIASGYAYKRDGTWEDARDKAVADAKAQAALWTPPPPDETIAL